MVSMHDPPVPVIRSLASIAFLAFVPLAAQAQYEGKPIPNGRDVQTNATYREGFYRYYLQLVEHYKQHTNDPDAVQTAGVKLLAAAVRARCLEQPDQTNDKLRELSRIAIEAGTKDPLILQRDARLRALDEDYEVARTTLLDCEERLPESGYPPIVAMLNSHYLCSLARMTYDDALMQAHFPKFSKRFSAWVEQESKVPANRRYVFDLAHGMTVDFGTIEQQRSLVDSLAQRDEIDPWLFDVLTGMMNFNIGWISQATGLAGDISTANAMRVSRERLQRAWEAQPDYPEAASLMITVALVGNDTASLRTWFDRAVAAEIDYPGAYRQFTNAIQPGWGGSHEAMSRFGMECLATKRFDTPVPFELYHQVASIESQTGQTDRYWRSPKVYEKLREMFEGYRLAPTLSRGHDLYTPRKKILTAYATVALVTRQWEDAVAAIKAIGGLDEETLKSVGGLALVSRASAMTGDAKELLAQADQLAESPSAETLAKAIDLVSTAMAHNTDKRAEPYLTSRQQQLQDLLDYERGEWVELTFDKYLSGWRNFGGTWTRESDTAVIGSQRSADGVFAPFNLRQRSRFRPPYQLVVNVEELAPESAQGAVGVTIGDVSFDGTRQASGRFCLVSDASVGLDHGIDSGVLHPLEGDKLVSMDIRVWPRSMLLLANGDGPIGTAAMQFEAGDQFGLSGRQAIARARFSNLRIRKLPHGSLLETQSPEQTLAEAEKMVDFDASDWYARWVRASAYLEAEHYEEALADSLELQRVQPDTHAPLYIAGVSHLKMKQYGPAIEKLNAALAIAPYDHRARRSLAEVMLTAESPPYRDLEGAFEHARLARNAATGSEDEWLYHITVADVYAARGDLTKAIDVLERVSSLDPVGQEQLRNKVVELHDRKGSSYKAAFASLLWEGDMTMRILGVALVVILLVANLIFIGNWPLLGRRFRCIAWAFGAAISVGIPCFLALMFGMGEGPAFRNILAGIIFIAAAIGACAGVFSGKKANEPDDDDGPLLAEVLSD